jgi:hypothetical protein
MKWKIVLLLACLSSSAFGFSFNNGIKNPYIQGSFLSGFAMHTKSRDLKDTFATSAEFFNGKVSWKKDGSNKKNTALSWPLVFDLKLISRYGFGICAGDALIISYTPAYRDNQHFYFGLNYVYRIKRFDIGAAVLVYPVYVQGDEVIAGKLDLSYWITRDIGLSAAITAGTSSGNFGTKATIVNGTFGLSLKFDAAA